MLELLEQVELPDQMYCSSWAPPASAAAFAVPRSAAYFVPATCAERLFPPKIVGFGQKFADFSSGSKKISFYDQTFFLNFLLVLQLETGFLIRVRSIIKIFRFSSFKEE